jgi:hypothetical protein
LSLRKIKWRPRLGEILTLSSTNDIDIHVWPAFLTSTLFFRTTRHLQTPNPLAPFSKFETPNYLMFVQLI